MKKNNMLDLTPKFFKIIPAKEKLKLPISFDDIGILDIKNPNINPKTITSKKTHLSAQVAECVVAKSGGEFTSIQAALNAGKKRIYIKAGTYTINSSITILNSNVLINGENEKNTIIKLANGANCDAIQIGNGTTALDNIEILHIQIDGNKANQTTGNLRGIYFYGANNYLIQRVNVLNCYIHDINGTGIETTYSKYCNIQNNQIEENNSTSIYVTHHSRYFNIIANQCNNNTNGPGIYLGSVDENGNHLILGNQCNNEGTDGITIASNYNIVIGNQTGDALYSGIYIANAHYNIVTGNQCNNCKGSYGGIQIYSSYYNIVFQNECINNTNHGIYMSTCNYNIIFGNYCRDNKFGIEIGGTENYVRLNYCRGNTTNFTDNGTNTIKAANTTNDNVI